ncbi:TPA: hypothetical protein QDA71_005493 [Burkholderia vietnamiensis]|uniref:DUF7673 family protein n=1 Tax=Burkholderia vietnamiensis TaxID=60552 RepID=UPI0015888C6E|nr:hypothetical protein [Burkholderia vietnamiensis]HDR8948427.1 hypothetical protein [Burkholderia vietnamiensis]HDR9210670.1 hypothetical protein [Burkholderia vietnamiensis]
MQPEQMTSAERAALERLLEHARGDTGQSRRVADFLLAWWNAGQCGSYDLTTAWSVDDAIMDDMCVVFRLASRANSYPDTLGYGPQFEAIVREWRPELVKE